MIHYLIIRFKRGKITPLTTDQEFADKAKEELNEWINGFSPDEATDVIQVIKNWMIHRKKVIFWYYLRNLWKQIIRKD